MAKSIMEDFETFYRDFIQFDDHLGIKLNVIKPGNVQYCLTVMGHHLSSPDACHGGVIAAMMDAVLGVSALSYAVSQGQLCSTVEFKINYLSPAQPGEVLVGTGNADFTGSTLIVASGDIIEENSGRTVAKGMGTFSQFPMDKKPFSRE